MIPEVYIWLTGDQIVAARGAVGRQFIFITPQGMNNADRNTDIKIIKYVSGNLFGLLTILISLGCKIQNETRGLWNSPENRLAFIAVGSQYLECLHA